MDLDGNCFRARFKLTPADLGLDPKEVDASLLNLGRGWLAPREEIRKIERIISETRRQLDNCSVPFPIQGARYVPVASFRMLEKMLSDMRENFDEAVDSFMKKWTEFRAETKRRWTKWAKQTWKRMTELRQTKDSEDVFVARFIERVEKLTPTESDVRSRFSLTWKPFQIAIPQGAQGKRVTVGEAEAKLAAFEKYEKIWDDQVLDFIRTTASALRERVAEVAEKTAKVFSERAVRGPSIEALRNTINEVWNLNFLEDEALTESLKKLRVLLEEAEKLRGDSKLRKDDEVVSALSKAISGVATEIVKQSQKSADSVITKFGGGLGKRKLAM